MLFLKLLESLDELLYEIASWIVFFPVTLWKIVNHPLKMMRYAQDELQLEPDQQYRATVSPPIMLVLAVLVAQTIAVASNSDQAILKSQTGLARLVEDDTTLFLLKLLLFVAITLMLATRQIHISRQPLDRTSLKPAFFAQCYAISPVALLLAGGGTVFDFRMDAIRVVGCIMIIAALAFYWVVETMWFRTEFGRSAGRAILDAFLGMAQSVAIIVVTGLLLVG